MATHTRAGGSTSLGSKCACSAIAFRSDASSAHDGQVARWAWHCASRSPSIRSGSRSWNSTQFINPLSPISSLFSSPLCGLFGSAGLEEFSQFQTRFVELRLAVADGTAHHSGNLIMLVTLNVVQYKDGAVPRGQPLDREFQLHP